MESYITLEQLKNLGVTLEGKELESLLSHLNQTVEERVGAEITAGLSDADLTKLVEVQQTGDEDTLDAWIIAHVPHYEEIIEETVDIVLGELADGVDSIK